MKHGRNFGLDLARSVAVLSVLFSHLLLEPAQHSPALIAALVYMGQTGVELFFSLSGFLIGGLLLDLSEQGPTPQRLGQFWFRRWARTLPLYYVVLWWVTWYTGQSEPHAWFFLQNYYPHETKLFPVAWSLVLEEYFYFFFPLAMLALSAVLGNGVRLVFAIASALIVICTAGRFANAYAGWNIGWDVVHEHPFLRMDCAAYGVLAACLYRLAPLRVGRFAARWGVPILLLGSVIVLAWGSVFVGVLTSPAIVMAAGFGMWGKIWFALQYSVLDLVFACVVVVFATTMPARTGWLARCVTLCSLLSYSIYLVHMMVLGWTDMYLHVASAPVKIVVQLALTFAISAFTYACIERPFLNLRDWVTGRRRLRAQAVAVKREATLPS